MPNIGPNITLNDRVLSTLWIGVEVSREPLRVHARHLSILLICGDVGGGGGVQKPIASLTESLHPVGDTIPQTGASSMGRPRIMATSCSVIVVSLDGRWNMWVFERHRSTSDVNAGPSIIDRSWLMSRASSRNPARRMNGLYHSPHVRGLCVQILSECKRCRTQQQKKY
jgi:hypothetical protein